MKMVSRRALWALVLTVGATAALAVAPALAAAMPVLKSGGKARVEGSTLRASSTNVMFVTEKGSWQCAQLQWEAVVTENPGIWVEEGSGGAEGCHAGVAPIQYTEVDVPYTFLTPGGTGESEFTFVYRIYLSASEFIQCQFNGIADIHWTNGSSILEIEESPFTGSGQEGCPGSMVLSGDLELETETGAPVVVEEL